MKLFIEETSLKPDYKLESISPLGEMLLFDIETTGLKKETTQIYMIGCGYFNAAGNFEVRQWMTESAADEREVLECFVEFSKGYKTLIHFNGDGFDIPYVDYKAQYYGMDLDFGAFYSFDIYKKIKTRKKFLGLDRMGQTAIERFLKIEREDKLNGGLLIPYYYEYEKTKDPECERLLLLHNNEDVKGMILLADILSYGDIFEGKYHVKNPGKMAEIFGETLIMEFELENAVKIPVLYENNDLMIAAEGKLLQINIKIFNGTARIPVKDIENYYYLPAEDTIIHKDVARFVDKKFRKKATAKNCFLKKDGRYVPSFGSDKTCYTDIDAADPENSPAENDISYMVFDEKGKLKPFLPVEKIENANADFVYGYSLCLLNNL